MKAVIMAASPATRLHAVTARPRMSLAPVADQAITERHVRSPRRHELTDPCVDERQLIEAAARARPCS